MTSMPSSVLVFIVLTISACVSVGEKKMEESNSIQPTTSEENLFEGDAAFLRGELDDAQVKYLVALNAEPENPDALYKIGVIYEAQGNAKLAEDSFRQALRFNHKHVNNNEALGLLLIKSGRYEEAYTLLKSVVVEDNDRWRTLNGLGVIYDMQKLHAQAQTFYRMALKLNNRSAQIANNLGYSLYLSGHWEEAEKNYQTAISIQPKHKQAWSNIALYYARIGNFEAALEAFKQISEDHQAANNVGYLSLLQENYDIAEQYFEIAIHESPIYYQLAHDNLRHTRNQQ